MRLARSLALWAALLLMGFSAQAHKASDAYLQIDSNERGTTVRWDIALRDLDLLVLAQAARASGRPLALDEAKRLTREIGLVDARIEALL